MSKKYEYSILTFEQKNGWYERENITLDHPITEADLSAMENADSTETNALNDYHVVTNWKLLSVTGTFTYRLMVSFRSPLGNIFLKSFPWPLSHKITAATIDNDYKTIKAQMDYLKVSMGIGGEVEILFHQEIPDE